MPRSYKLISRFPAVKPPRSRLQFILIVLAAVVLTVSVYFDSYLETEALRTESPVPIEEGWTIAAEDGILEKNTQLPYSISGPVEGRTFTVSGRLPDAFPNTNASFSIDTSMTSLEILLDGKRIYAFSGDGTPWRKPVLGGGFTHFVRLPDWAPGHQLTMLFTFTSDNVFSGLIRAPLIGTQSDLMLAQLKEWPSLVFGFVFLFVGFVSVLVSLGLRRGKPRNSLWYFGWLEFVLGAWVFTQTCSKFIIMRNPVLPMNFSFAALFMLPYFLVQYVRSSYRVIDRKIRTFHHISLLFLAAYIIGGVIQYIGFFDYSDMLIYSGLALVIFIISLFIVLIIDYFRGNRELISFLAAIGALFAAVLAEEILLIFNIVIENAVPLHLGMSLCGALLLAHSARVISQGQRTQFKEEILLELAYTDSLTGAGNRAAYEEHAASIRRGTDDSASTGVILCDINDLKPINDTWGHAEGDTILKDFTAFLIETLPPDADIFRIGGDEFVAFITNVTAEQLDFLTDQISCRQFENEICTYTVAAGSAWYSSRKGINLDAVISEADVAMYACKTSMKESMKAQTQFRRNLSASS